MCRNCTQGYKRKNISFYGWTCKYRCRCCFNDIQENIYNKAKIFRDNNITKADTWEEFEKLLDDKGGFISAHWDGTAETEEKIKELTKATIRCIPLNNTRKKVNVFLTGNPS